MAEQLYADLQEKGVRCWFAPKDMRIGRKILDSLFDAIRKQEKLLLILSEKSVESDWVEDEVTRAFGEERDRKDTVIFPIRIDDSVMVSAKAWATHTCTIEDNVSRTVRNDFSYPTGCMLRFHFAARQNMPELELFWYDGGMKPRLPRELEMQNVEMDREGILFVGDQGMIMAGFNGQDPRLFAKGQSKPLQMDESSSRTSRRSGRHSAWLEACRGGDPSLGSFLNAAVITDAVNLGTVALRAGKKVLFDSDKMKITNDSEADKYLYREYRDGWELRVT